MTEISKAAHYRSFYEVARMLPDAERLAFYDSIDALRFEGEIENIETLPFNVKMAITAIKPIIEADVGRKDGGAPMGNNNATKGATCRKCTHRGSCPDKDQIDASQCSGYLTKQPKTTVDLASQNNYKTTVENNYQNNPPKQPKTNNVNVNDNDNVNVNGKGNVNDENNAALPLTVNNEIYNLQEMNPEGATDYARQIYDKFTAAGLPNCNNNFFSFLQMDFRNAHNKIAGIHSDDVLKAVDNYINLLNDPESYISFKYNFESFVNSKLFSNCLPANFVKENYRTYDAQHKKAEVKAQEIKKDYPEPPKNCIQCGAEINEHYILDHYSYYCPGCINTYRFNSKAKKWELEVPA